MNQREFYEAQVIALKAFGNWRAKFKAEPEPPLRKLLYRRGSISHTLSHTLSHVTYSSSVLPTVPLVLPPRPGHRRRFGEADRRHILAENGRARGECVRGGAWLWHCPARFVSLAAGAGGGRDGLCRCRDHRSTPRPLDQARRAIK